MSRGFASRLDERWRATRQGRPPAFGHVFAEPEGRLSRRRRRAHGVRERSDVVFAAAGGCGLGALQAANDRGAWGIGVDNDQSFLGPHILTSATKKVDEAVFRTIEEIVTDTFDGGADTLFNVQNGGIGFGEVSPDASDRGGLITTLEDVAAEISAGEITPPRE